MRTALAIVVGAAALAGAAFLGVAHLKLHGHYHCTPGSGPAAGSCDLQYSYWTVGREWWQIPAAVLLAVVGIGAAFVLLKGLPRRSPA